MVFFEGTLHHFFNPRENSHEKEDIHLTQQKAWFDVLSISSSHFTCHPNVPKKQDKTKQKQTEPKKRNKTNPHSTDG